jgi:hypothetical protein
MNHRSAFALLSAFIPLFLLACGAAPKKTYMCTGVAKIEIDPALEMGPDAPDAFSLPKGADVDIGLKAVDADGKECDPAGLMIDTGGDLVTTSSTEDGIRFTATRDLFDNGGAEPTATLTVSGNGVTRRWKVYGVVNLQDTWTVRIVIGDGGFDGEFVFQQQCRTLRYEGRSEAGLIRESTLTLNTSTDPMTAGLTLTGTIDPSRQRVSGTWTLNDDSGTWTAERAAPPQ